MVEDREARPRHPCSGVSCRISPPAEDGARRRRGLAARAVPGGSASRSRFPVSRNCGQTPGSAATVRVGSARVLLHVPAWQSSAPDHRRRPASLKTRTVETGIGCGSNPRGTGAQLCFGGVMSFSDTSPLGVADPILRPVTATSVEERAAAERPDTLGIRRRMQMDRPCTRQHRR